MKKLVIGVVIAIILIIEVVCYIRLYNSYNELEDKYNNIIIEKKKLEEDNKYLDELVRYWYDNYTSLETVCNEN